MAYMSDDYKPNKKSRDILTRAWEHVHTVEYAVSARWLFYRLLQDSIYSKKSDYQRFLQLTSRARHNYWQGWRPNTLTDETRERIARGGGNSDVGSWARYLAKWGVSCTLDKWRGQSTYVEIWFEANAMASQFRHHTQYITLSPFGGMPSIPYKYEIAHALSWAGRNYGFASKSVVFWRPRPGG